MQVATQAARCGRPCLGLRHNADQLAEMLRLDFNQVRGFETETEKSQFETEKSQFETEKSQFDTEKCQFSGQAQARAGARWG